LFVSDGHARYDTVEPSSVCDDGHILTPERNMQMAEPRVKAGLWVQMALRLGDLGGRSGVVVRRGDADAGGVLVVLRGRTGLAVLSQLRAADGTAAWMRATGAEPVDELAVNAYVARQVKVDPDLWVLEFEAPDLLPPFEGRIV
jgi:hypothetical protein